MSTSNFDKFSLLMWKNWKLQWTNKRSTVFEILIPILLTSLLILIRYIVNPIDITFPVTFPEHNISLDLLKKNMDPNTPSPVKTWELAYSPQNILLENIITAASEKLNVSLIGLKNSEKLELYMQQENHSLVGIQFDDNLDKITEYPQDISYSLRFPSELRMHSIEFPRLWQTQYLYPLFDFGGPRNPHYSFGGEPGYIREGFIAVQNAISLSIIEMIAESKSKSNTINLPEIKMHRMPYPPYKQDNFLPAIEAFIPLIILLSYIHLASETIKYITTEKEKQLKEVMKIMGLANWLHWLAWFTKTFLLMATSLTIIVIMLEIPWVGDSNLAVFTYSHWSCILIFLYAYCISAICYFFMMTTFFTHARTAAAVNGLIWFLFYIPYAMTQTNYKNLNLFEKMLLCLFHNTGLGYGFKLILHYEGTGEGLQWSNLFHPVNIDDKLSVGLIIITLLLSAILYMLIALYVEKIYPGDFGVPEKWYFIFKKDFWITKKKQHINDDDDMESNNNNNNNDKNTIEENLDKNKSIGVSIKNLNKNFHDKQAVKNLSMNLYENEITVLLGHNGAGKTTTISMLTGMIPPSSGTAIINGSDIRTNLKGVRMSLGLCPQHNILFDDLTVKEHIIFYSRVKGIKGDNEINKEVQKYIQILELENKLNTPSKNLSGGMKRKLSVICALCGNTKIVFLDEPSSGMDPAARRTLWDILQSEKKNRTILLTTHYMDEADAVGDRIAIMSASELKCYGTSFYLKKKYGSGYHLICVKKENCDPDQVTNLLKKYIPDIEIDKNIGTELSYKLPDASSIIFEEMLGELEDNSNQLNLEGYGISIPTLEEVFMIVGSENHDDSKENNINNLDVEKNICEFGAINEMDVNKLTKTKMIISQWKAMLLKKYLYSKRNYIIFLLQNIIVIFLVIVTILVQRTQEQRNALPPLPITLNSYADTVSILENKPNLRPFQLNISNEYEKYTKSFGDIHKVTVINDQSFTDYILKQNVVEMKTKYLIGTTISNKKIVAWFNNQLLHTAPLALNLIHNAILKALYSDYSIEVTNRPLPKSIKTIQAENVNGSDIGFQLALNLCIGLSFACAFYVLFLIKERESRAKLLQFVSGVRVIIFWLSHFLFDYFTFIIITLLIIITITCFQQDGYTTFDELGRMSLVILCFGLAIIPFIYVLSMLFKEPVTGYSYTSLFNIICVALFIIVFVMRFLDKEELAEILNYIFLMFPIYSLATALNCLNIISSTADTCIKQCKYIGIPENLCKLDLICLIDDKCCLTDYFDFKFPGIAWNLIYMILTCIICLIILLIGSLRLIKEWLHSARMLIAPPPISHTFENSNIDDDVIEENKRIANMSSDEIKSNNLILNHATKYYGKLLAVNQVSVGINHSECFGLLGINGAGKTTLFKMMTGDEIITYGDAYVKGKKLRNQMNEVYRDIGYCPQFDALLEDLTGREILRIFCLLRGIPEDRINPISNQMAKLFGYTKHIDKPCKTYSGGNKRKLSTSIAILGCPSVIYLDEPTSGMDPGARRQLWNVVNQVRSSGKSIILTSHSMEECEALCTRLAIMVNGEFKCIGSTQHLKNKFAKGLVLKIKAKRDEKPYNEEIQEESLNDEKIFGNIDKIKIFLLNLFPAAVLQEEYQEILTFNIPLSSIKWSQIFGIIEKNKEELNIEDYSISQTTLEQIFLSFAQHQREDNRITGGKFKPGKTVLKQSYIRSVQSKSNADVVDV